MVLQRTWKEFSPAVDVMMEREKESVWKEGISSTEETGGEDFSFLTKIKSDQKK